MSIIKSFSVCDDNGEAGDMFYIKHNSSNFTIIDCCLNCEDRESIVSEIIDEKRNKNIIRVKLTFYLRLIMDEILEKYLMTF